MWRRPEEARDVFQAGVVSEEHFLDNAASVLSDPHLLARIDGLVYRWRQAVPALAARVLYPTVAWERLLSGGMPIAEPFVATRQPSAPSQVKQELYPHLM